MGEIRFNRSGGNDIYAASGKERNLCNPEKCTTESHSQTISELVEIKSASKAVMLQTFSAMVTFVTKER
jgi:hypothetical protein